MLMRLICLAVVVGGALYAYDAWRPRLREVLAPLQATESESVPELAEADVGLTYVLDPGRWITFPVPPAVRQLKVLTNANFPKGFAAPPGQRWWYQLRYQMRTSDGDTVVDRIYHFHTQLTRYATAEQPEGQVPRFYLSEPYQAGDMRMMLIPVPAFEGITRIRFQLSDPDSAILDAVLRVYYPEETQPARQPYLWLRLREEKKARLARGNLYPPVLLSETETENLLEQLWRPLGPTGIAGTDYQVRRLYELKEVEGPEIGMAVFPEGLYIQRGHRGTIPLPDLEGTVRLAFVSAPWHTPDPDTDTRIRWYGPRPFDRSECTIAPESAAFTGRFRGGLLEIEAGRDLVVRAYLQLESGEEMEITPDPMLIRAYVITPEDPLDFPIHHLDQRPTPWRIDLRRQVSLLAGGDPPKIRYQLLDAGQSVLDSGEMRLPLVPSLYDRLADDVSGLTVTEKWSWYFRMSPEVAVCRLFASGSVMVAAYDRSPDMVRRTRVPADYMPYRLQEDEREPPWFPVLPDGHLDLMMANRMVLLTTQLRPPEENPDLLAGRYDWTDFDPDRQWRGRYLLVPVDPRQIRHDAQRPAAYRPVPVGRTTVLTFQGEMPRMRRINPKLFYSRRTDDRAPVAVQIDGKTFFTATLSGRRGEFRLPLLPAGPHQLQVDAPRGTDLFMSHAGPGEGPLLKRFARRFLRKAPLRFIYTKSSWGEETLMAHLFLPLGAGPATIRVAVRPLTGSMRTPADTFTFPVRRFEVTPESAPAAFVLDTPNAFTDAGSRIWLPLGTDLGPGEYAIEFNMETGQDGYLILSEIRFGVFEQRELLRQEGGELVSEQ